MSEVLQDATPCWRYVVRRKPAVVDLLDVGDGSAARRCAGSACAVSPLHSDEAAKT
jgi:hypothetical protein